MIAGTYLVSAAMLVVVAVIFNGEQFSDWGLTLRSRPPSSSPPPAPAPRT